MYLNNEENLVHRSILYFLNNIRSLFFWEVSNNSKNTMILCAVFINTKSGAAVLTSVHLSPSQVLLKLFSYCVKVKINRQQLVKPEMNTLNVMLGTLNLVSFAVLCSLISGEQGDSGAVHVIKFKL